MSGNIARAHTSQTNRAKVRLEPDRKAVVKSVVENPFRVQWPSVPVNVQNAILASIVHMLDGVAEYNVSKERASRRKRRSRGSHGGSSKKAKTVHGDSTGASSSATAMEVDEVDSGIPDEPAVLNYVTVGINEVTKELENFVQTHRRTVTTHAADQAPMSKPTASAPLGIVIACRGDIDSPLLIEHLPNLVAACNSTRMYGASSSESVGQGGTWLVPMSKGAEVTLAEAMGLRRVSVLLVEATAPRFSVLASLLENVSIPTAPWLSLPPTNPSLSLVPTHIKQLRTTAPKDMKAAKERRAKERAAAKECRRTYRRIPKRVTLSATV